MDGLFQNPKLLEAFTGLIKVIFAIFAGLASGLWAFNRWYHERQDARKQEQNLAQARLEQQRIEEQNRRSDQAAQLIRDFGNAADQTNRLWTALALTLYPEETLPLLVNCLGHLDDPTGDAVELALVSLGLAAAPQIIKMNRIARSRCERAEPAEEIQPDQPAAVGCASLSEARLLERSRRVLAQILLFCDPKDLATIDLSDVDLTGSNFKFAKFNDIHFRKAILNGAIFSRAKLGKANFRGALIDKAVFTRASLDGADFTGARGAAHMIRIYAEDGIFDEAELTGSILDGADLKGCRLQKTNLEGCSLGGAQLSNTHLAGCHLHKVAAKGLKMAEARLDEVDLSRADLKEARLNNSHWEKCKLNACLAASVVAHEVHFLDSNLGGINFDSADLEGTIFRGCNLGGAVFHHANLTNCEFSKCNLSSASFLQAKVSGAKFLGDNQVENLEFAGANWQEAIFDEKNQKLKQLVTAGSRGGDPSGS